jgi:hypothetical protein
MEELFKINGIVIHTDFDPYVGYQFLVFRSKDGSFGTSLRWDPMQITSDGFWAKYSNQIKNLLYNKIAFENKQYESEKEVIDFINLNTPKYTPQEKLDLVLDYFYSKTNYDGEAINFSVDVDLNGTEVWRKFYFTNGEEFEFYLNNLIKEEYLEISSDAKGEYTGLKLSINGLSKIIKIAENSNSRFCFVAMSFDPSMASIYDHAIAPAINETGFLPFIVNNIHVDSDKTINDEIIAGIKKAHFTIADFTHHKAGVYFEAGYALGRGQKVIYCCKQEEIQAAHFDTRNYQHIVWKSEVDLKEKLVNKINAFIKE